MGQHKKQHKQNNKYKHSGDQEQNKPSQTVIFKESFKLNECSTSLLFHSFTPLVLTQWYYLSFLTCCVLNIQVTVVVFFFSLRIIWALLKSCKSLKWEFNDGWVRWFFAGRFILLILNYSSFLKGEYWARVGVVCVPSHFHTGGNVWEHSVQSVCFMKTWPTSGQHLASCSLCMTRQCAHTHLVDSADLTLDAVVLGPGATRPLVARHVHTHHMLVSGEVLRGKSNTPRTSDFTILLKQ